MSLIRKSQENEVNLLRRRNFRRPGLVNKNVLFVRLFNGMKRARYTVCIQRNIVVIEMIAVYAPSTDNIIIQDGIQSDGHPHRIRLC